MTRSDTAVATIAASGEKTLVLLGEGLAGHVAARMLPRLPEVCFVQADAAGGVREAALEAAGHALDRLVLLATVEDLAALDPADGLGGITADMGGTPALAADVAAAGSARRAYELWEGAGLLGQCGRELCRRVADGLELAAAASTGADRSPIAAQVVLMDPGGERMVGMYGRLGR
ncbi:hypothetical protein GCM10010191_62450 [Actinomadura vinacea]|uniref:Uncharacterized protein n=1 Tax=Actinomadura vinacea TaxID=115336 RepID=A0ABP5WXJ6_9ACTN